MSPQPDQIVTHVLFSAGPISTITNTIQPFEILAIRNDFLSFVEIIITIVGCIILIIGLFLQRLTLINIGNILIIAGAFLRYVYWGIHFEVREYDGMYSTIRRVLINIFTETYPALVVKYHIYTSLHGSAESHTPEGTE